MDVQAFGHDESTPHKETVSAVLDIPSSNFPIAIFYRTPIALRQQKLQHNRPVYQTGVFQSQRQQPTKKNPSRICAGTIQDLRHVCALQGRPGRTYEAESKWLVNRYADNNSGL
ncbi:hypothetical protein PAAG_07817 [Paracoccidioides lutzii Pb01]|uniref:Uncharacterized protein n=1 Tax=Paracoccidioides lutzii (strain ATCC MYA-826 / Pb01) TaxID=502779 RepID=C1HA88_PARBA|nr:hypothetical protein PAAG_07817 [Paracoccidioides lutzii Pb01]EEH37261.2 hypothetical protein PAAG_07817 [Paracoccidioides lutzii Pb01]